MIFFDNLRASSVLFLFSIDIDAFYSSRYEFLIDQLQKMR